MKRAIVFFTCLLFFVWSSAQQKAITDKGEEVILYNDGTWAYENEDNFLENKIVTNSKKFKKDKESTFLLKSSKLDIGFWLNPKKWSFEKATENSEAEYELQLKGEDLYGMIITEKVEIPIESLKSIALENGKIAAPDLKVVKEEYRIVNDLKVLLLQMDGTIQGIKFSYYGYYVSGANGTIQFITYTSQNLLNSYLKDSEILLNGIVELD